MKTTLGAVMAEAARLWRSERGLLVPLAGVFYVVPMLGMALLMAGLNLPEQADAAAMRAAIMAFYNENLIAILAVNVTVDFGTFAILNLYLQGGGRTLGEVLLLTGRRFPQFIVIDLVAGVLFAFGLSLVVPGLFVFARTWLAGPAVAAQPGRGILNAFRQGWRHSGGLTWLLILFAALLVLLGGASAVLLAAQVLGLAASLTGSGAAMMLTGYLVLAALGGAVWTMLTLLRVAFYRLAVSKQGM